MIYIKEYADWSSDTEIEKFHRLVSTSPRALNVSPLHNEEFTFEMNNRKMRIEWDENKQSIIVDNGDGEDSIHEISYDDLEELLLYNNL